MEEANSEANSGVRVWADCMRRDSSFSRREIWERVDGMNLE